MTVIPPSCTYDLHAFTYGDRSQRSAVPYVDSVRCRHPPTPEKTGRFAGGRANRPEGGFHRTACELAFQAKGMGEM